MTDTPPGDGYGFDASLLRGMTSRRISRRDALRYAGRTAGGLGAAAFLAACGVSGTAKKASPAPSANPLAFWKGKTKTGTLVFENWPDYIDVDAKGNSPTIKDFEQATGINVTYKTDISDNDPFLAKVLPVLGAGQNPGFDLMVITNGSPIEKLLRLNYLIPLDHRYLPNFEKYASPSVKNPNYDPGNRYTVAWQSGFTGIAWNSKKIKRPITSFKDLMDPEFKGRVGMFGNNQDLPNAAIVGLLNKDPQQTGPAEWQQIANTLKQQRDSGIVRSYYDQNYIDALENGDTWITQAWSGDIFIAALSKADGGDGFPEMRFTIPNEGGLIWTDNMCIPIHAAHPVDAIMMMDFVYQPKIAAQMADFIDYVTPVPEAKPVLEKEDPSVANSPLVFPDAATLSKVHRYRTFKTPQEEQQWNSIFEPVYQA